jgi:hypothetical protein
MVLKFNVAIDELVGCVEPDWITDRNFVFIF